MKPFQIFWEHSPFWLLPVFLISAGAAWFLYAQKGDWSPSVRTLLFALRTVFLFLVLSLLLNPLLRNFRETTLPPVSVVLVDNSTSVGLGTSADSIRFFRSRLKEMVSRLENSGSRVFVTGLDGKALSDTGFRFTKPSTDIEPAFRRLREEFQNQNLAQVILASDGIINQGGDLGGVKLPFRVHTIRMGDPRPRKDILIREVRANKLAYFGNSFPVSVQIKGLKAGPSPVKLSLSEGGKILESRMVTLSRNGLANVEFSIRPQAKGVRKYQVDLEPIEGELTLENNRRTFFIEVVDSRQKVLLLASAPHPDIKAIRAALGSLEQVELTTVIGGLDSWKQENWNLVILHQLPDRVGSFRPQVSSLLRSGNTSVWVIATGQTDFSTLRQEASSWLTIQGAGGVTDEVGVAFDEGFQGFLVEENWRKTFADLPPIRSPGFSYSWKSPSETILVQKLGRVISPTPLLSASVEGLVKRAVFWGDGLWLWRLNEFRNNEKTEAFDNLMVKTVQLLLSADKKRRLRVVPGSPELQEGEQARLSVETFNQLFEPVYDQKVAIELRRSDGVRQDFTFVNGRGNSVFLTPSLPEGVYKYKASVLLGGKEETDEGEFLVRSFNLEASELEANHGWLESLSASTGGRTVGIREMVSLAAGTDLPKPLIEFTEWDENLLQLKWLLALLLTLISMEWAIRKWNGSL